MKKMGLKEIQKRIKDSAFDAIILTGLENPTAAKNLKYVTGYTGSFGFAVIGKDYQYFLSDFRYRDQAALEAPDFTFVEISGSIVIAIKGIIEKEKIEKLGFDKKMRYSEYEMYQSLLCELVPLDNFIEKFRISKQPFEIELLRKACQITDQALKDILGIIKVGMTEREVEISLKNRMIELGADSTWERFVVASGERGAMPHGMATDKVIESGEMVTFDIGCFYKGYSSDLTRTVAMGKPSAMMREIYNIVYDAQRKTVMSAKAGMTGKELDSVARNYITEHGYGDFFKHGTGHGLGLDVHENPRVSQANDKPLELGACVTIEPGIYVKGLGGVRIEDDIILTEDSCIVLNEFPRELIIIE